MSSTRAWAQLSHLVPLSLSLYPSAFIPPHHYLIYECDNNKNENKNENKNKQHSPPPPPK